MLTTKNKDKCVLMKIPFNFLPAGLESPAQASIELHHLTKRTAIVLNLFKHSLKVTFKLSRIGVRSALKPLLCKGFVYHLTGLTQSLNTKIRHLYHEEVAVSIHVVFQTQGHVIILSDSSQVRPTARSFQLIKKPKFIEYRLQFRIQFFDTHSFVFHFNNRFFNDITFSSLI